MRWIWIDKFIDFQTGKSAVALKAVTAAEEHVHDLYPAYTVFPHSLIIEGIAQTAGILIGDTLDYAEKVILAKIGKADFFRIVRPGEVLRYEVVIETLHQAGASVTGHVTSNGERVGEISLMFSHIDQNMAGLAFPEHNFVFMGEFMDLLDTYRREVSAGL